MRIAVATDDGQNVDEHFGTARSFQFYDIEGSTIEIKETRSNAPWCGDNAETQFDYVNYRRIARGND